jgi:hypothetical protein
MALNRLIVALTLLTLSCIDWAQVKPQSTFAKGTVPQTGEAMLPLADTVGRLKGWIDTENNDDLAWLFTQGEAINSDLLAACRDKDDQTALAAYIVRQLLGKPPCGECPDAVRKQLGKLAPACQENLTAADLARINLWWAGRKTPNGFRCNDEEGLVFDPDIRTDLIIHTSPESRPVLIRMLAFDSLCAEAGTVTPRALDQAQSLAAVEFEQGQHLMLEPDIGASIRASAFFIAPQDRKQTKVEVVARQDDRILLEVSYVCGGTCGRGYYVVLRRNASTWRYAEVILAWVA